MSWPFDTLAIYTLTISHWWLMTAVFAIQILLILFLHTSQPGLDWHNSSTCQNGSLPHHLLRQFPSAAIEWLIYDLPLMTYSDKHIFNAQVELAQSNINNPLSIRYIKQTAEVNLECEPQHWVPSACDRMRNIRLLRCPNTKPPVYLTTSSLKSLLMSLSCPRY